MKSMKIYGMHGLLEWHGHVHCGNVSMKVDFTNGSTTAYGVAPATYITKDPVTQVLMENSKEFKSGRIRLLKAVPLPREEEPAEKTAGTATGEAAGAVKGDAGKAEDEAIMTFSCNDDAKDYLADTYGVPRSKMMSRKAIETAAKEQGVSIEWTD